MPQQSAILQLENWVTALDLLSIFKYRKTKPACSEPRRLEVEIGCGKGSFLIARATAKVNTDFIGIDRMLKRLRVADRKITRNNLRNVALIRIEASYAIKYIIPENSVDAFFILFPDPWPKRKHHPKRLFQKNFVTDLAGALKTGGEVHVATDHTDYFEWIRNVVADSNRFNEIPPYSPAPNEHTNFEILFINRNVTIHRCSFRLACNGPLNP